MRRSVWEADILGRDVAIAFASSSAPPVFAGWANRRQLDVIEYLQEENRLLEDRLRVGGIFALPLPNVAGLQEKLKHSGAWC
jgi:hypothetical protein